MVLILDNDLREYGFFFERIHSESRLVEELDLLMACLRQ
jgi:hypothetical protein